MGGILPPDVPVIMFGDSGEKLRLTLVAINRPEARLVEITVRAENLSGTPYREDLARWVWLIDADNQFYGRSITLTEARRDDESLRTFVFEVDGDPRLIRFRLSLRPGAPERTQDWYLV